MRLPAQLLHREPKSHKGNFGHIFILAGSGRFSGAGVLCAEAAMRCGAGLVTLGIPKSLNNAIIKIKPKEVMTLSLPETRGISLSLKGYKKIEDFAKGVDVLVIGPGLSQNGNTQSLIRKIIPRIDKPLLVDADGLNALAGHLDILRLLKRSRRKIILTPHPGEMSRLLNLSVNRIQKNRKDIVKKISKDYNVIVVLKGYRTEVGDYRGSLYTNKTGNPGMATAGSGDVLTGMIAAFLAQGLEAFKAAKYGVYLHGLAGDLAAKEKTQIGMIASDIIAKIPEAIKRSA